MPKQYEIDNTKVFTVYSLFQQAMLKAGRKIQFPRCSDKTKTYQFRSTKNFTQKCYEEYGLDDTVVGFLISDIVSYAKKRNLLNKGTQLLCMNNVVDICVKSIESLAADEAFLIEELRSCRAFLRDQAIDKNILVRTLLEPVNQGGSSNIVYWYNLGRLSETYLALSRTCNKAMTKLSPQERTELPSRFELLRICTHTVSSDLLPQLQAVMGSDLRIPPTTY
jgi:uncharacterized protein (DUF983 family)